MTRTNTSAPTNVTALSDVQTMKSRRTEATRTWDVGAGNDPATDRFPPVDDVVKNLRLFDRIAAVA